MRPQHVTVPPTRTAHTCHHAEIATNCPLGGSLGVLPQQVIVLSVRSPHAWLWPTVTALNCPAGGPGWLVPLPPQQARVPSVRIPQVAKDPESSALNCPAGASSWPSMLLPQQAMVPSVRIPHECQLPELTVWNDPKGALTR